MGDGDCTTGIATSILPIGAARVAEKALAGEFDATGAIDDAVEDGVGRCVRRPAWVNVEERSSVVGCTRHRVGDRTDF
jgi:hypothetical protein